MWSSAIVAALHYLALAIGLPAVFLRGRALKGPLDDAGLRRLFAADSAWGVAAALWVATGSSGRSPGSRRAPPSTSRARFYLKMALFLAIVALEIWPMLTFMRWRQARRRGARAGVDPAQARALFKVNHIQLALALVMVFVASAMARGLW